MVKLKTNIPMLDEVLNGGIEKNSSVLLFSYPGVEETTFLGQFIYFRLQQGDSCLYFVNNKKIEAIKNKFKEFDWNIEEFERKGKFKFFDFYSSLLGFKSNEEFFVENIRDIEELNKKLLDAIKKIKNNNSIFVFDTLSTFIDLYGEKGIDYIKKWVDNSKKTDVLPIFLFTIWYYDKSIVKKIKELFDCVIELKTVEQRIFVRNYFSVEKASWLKKIENKVIPFKILKPGGVHIYIPKILVTGPFNAGKTSFIHSASVKAVSVDRLSTTIALDHGHVIYKGFAVDLFGTPGQERFDPILELLGAESLGVIVVVDSTNPDSFERAKEMIKKTKTEGLPLVVVANKANLKGALKLEEIRKKMKLPKEVPIIPTVAEDLSKVEEGKPCKLKKRDVEKVLNKLFEMVFKE